MAARSIDSGFSPAQTRNSTGTPCFAEAMSISFFRPLSRRKTSRDDDDDIMLTGRSVLPCRAASSSSATSQLPSVKIHSTPSASRTVSATASSTKRCIAEMPGRHTPVSEKSRTAAAVTGAHTISKMRVKPSYWDERP